MSYIEEDKDGEEELESLDPSLEDDELSEEAESVTDDETFEEEALLEKGAKSPPIRKKVAALKARHQLEDYFESKKIRQELDYLEEDGDISEQSNL